MRIKTKLVKEGNSWVIRLPKNVLALSGLRGGEAVNLEVSAGRITIRSQRQPALDDEVEAARLAAKQAWNEAFEETWLALVGTQE
jgi:antitoxin component of MazEF toxin-antitoxin module